MSTIQQMLRFSFFLILVRSTVILSSCDDEDPPLADNLVEFQSDEIGFDASEPVMPVTINLSRQASADGTITLQAETIGLIYDEEFTTNPPIINNTLALPVTKGSSELSFEVIKKEGTFFDGDEKLIFSLSDVGQGLVAGEKSQISVMFSEIVAAQGTIDPQVGGSAQPNKVFIDLSANRQTVLNRGEWDLGFYTGEGTFRVVLNSSSSMMARALDKNDLNAVSAADTAGWKTQLSTDAVFAAISSSPVPSWVASSMAWIDDPAGDISKTAIAAISANDAENKVYIVNRGKNPDGSQRGWKKIRVTRSGDGYALQHADISATSFSTIQVVRKSDYLFNYVKFENGIVQIEPKKDKWDIAFTTFTYSTAAGPSLVVPYVFNDIVLQNRHLTETAELLVSSAGSFEDFGEDDLGTITFSQNQVNIGSKWRSAGGPGGGTPGTRSDRFYLVKDGDGNIYKIKFTALAQQGERGRPQFQFALVKKSS